MPRKISAGAIITDGVRFLVCHPTGHDFWDLPKGKIEPDEDPLEACIREVKEETDYDIPEDAEIEEMGLFPYLPAKDLMLFRITIKEIPEVGKLKCDSMVELPNRKPFPEVNAYKFIEFEKIPEHMTKNMQRTLKLAGLYDGNS